MLIPRLGEWDESRRTRGSEPDWGLRRCLLTFGRYSPFMAKEIEKDPLGRWRGAENDYAETIATFMQGDSAPLSKDELIALIDLRSEADKWRERYFKKNYKG